MRLHDSDHHIFATAVPADGLAEHVVGLADTRRVAQEQLEHSLLLFGRGFFQPLFRGLLHAAIVVERSKIVDVGVRMRS